jgi:hypothetical protein
MKINKIAAMAALVAAFGAGMFTHVDLFPKLHSYGVSIGTDSHYCYIDYSGNNINLGCEAAR